MARGVSANEERKYQVESIVRNAIEKTPAFKSAVKQTASQLKTMEKGITVSASKKKR